MSVAPERKPTGEFGSVRFSSQWWNQLQSRWTRLTDMKRHGRQLAQWRRHAAVAVRHVAASLSLRVHEPLPRGGQHGVCGLGSVASQ